MTPPIERTDRRHTVKKDRDQRTEFQRDRDRILYSAAFRRLAGVTQVVHVGEGHNYHNRLTHSLKVAQVGRRLAEFLISEHSEEEIEAVGGINQDVVETVSLAHDLGHPPFGHAAEEELNDRTEHKGVRGGFEGNPQSFRIVTKVATRRDDHRGLDLTRATLNALLKYPWSRESLGKKGEKWGYYPTEQEDFDFATDLSTPGDETDGRSVEAEIMDWADDLAYAIHDVTDFYRAGLIPLGEVLRGTEERKEFVESFYDKMGDKIRGNWNAEQFISDDLNKIVKVSSSSEFIYLHSPYNNSREEQASLNFFTSELVERYLGVNGKSKIELNPDIPGGLEIDDKLKNEIMLLKYLTKYYVFKDPALVAQQRGHKEIVGNLFDVLYNASEEKSKFSGMIPAPFDQEMDAINDSKGDEEAKHARARLAADIIASMTEQQVINMHKRITGSVPGSVTDKIIH